MNYPGLPEGDRKDLNKPFAKDLLKTNRTGSGFFI
jgi:hypothetical protein